MLLNRVSFTMLNGWVKMNKHVYTEYQLDRMSDLEKIFACAEKMGYEIILTDKDSINVKIPNFGETHYYNPLENYNDCMPIADKYEIASIPLAGGDYCMYQSHDRNMTLGSYSEDRKRAIVYCFLLMEV